MRNESGFSLVELLVVIAIVSILSAVATPAYINYQNRSKQTEAVEALLRAKMDQEAFFAENGRYANTIGCLYSFANSCAKTTYMTSSSTAQSYTVSVVNSGAATVKRINAQRVVPATAQTDLLHITTNDTCRTPIVDSPGALKFSLFSWIFK
ncbi:MAG: prepilin-type N-terminal cleavage/methylation domain-containing protein [Syntrophobacteraceae bacterium]